MLQHTSNLHGNTPPPIYIAVPSCLLSLEERETQKHTSHLHCSMPPICTAVRPPFVRQCFWGRTGGWGHRKAGTFSGAPRVQAGTNGNTFPIKAPDSALRSLLPLLLGKYLKLLTTPFHKHCRQEIYCFGVNFGGIIRTSGNVITRKIWGELISVELPKNTTVPSLHPRKLADFALVGIPDKLPRGIYLD